MTLVDTSVWIDHLRNGNTRLKELLQDGKVLSHAFVLGEIACGSLARREEILGLLAALPRAETAENEEALRLIEARRLYGRGLGWVDIHLLASTLLTGCGIWSFDKSLTAAAVELGISDRR